MSMSLTELEHALRALRLSGMSATLQARALAVASHEMDFLEAFSLLVQDEVDRRRSRLLDRRYTFSGLTEQKDCRAAILLVTRVFEHEHRRLMPFDDSHHRCDDLFVPRGTREIADCPIMRVRGAVKKGERVAFLRRIHGEHQFVGVFGPHTTRRGLPRVLVAERPENSPDQNQLL